MVSISTSESDDEAEDRRWCNAEFHPAWKVPSWMCWTAGGCVFAACTVLMLASMEMRRLFRPVSAWQLGPRMQIVNNLQSDCPCDCERSYADDDDDVLVEQQRCRAGDTCYFGNGWCSRTIPSFAKSPSSTHLAWGTCKKKRCGGPRADIFNVTCDRSKDPPFAVDWLVKHFGSQVRALLKDGAPGVNRHLNAPGGSLDASGLHGWHLVVSNDLIDTLEVQLERLSVVWQIGCWPPARYVVAGGALRVSSGWVRLMAGDIVLEVLVSNAMVSFKNLRVEISCPEGVFTIDGFGDGALNAGALSTASLEVSPGTQVSGIHCTGGWGIWCSLVTRLAPATFVWEQLPAVLVDVIQSFTGFGLADGCRLSRNSFALLPYARKDCCEESYSTDHTGCLIGGQFNGRLMPQGYVQGVDCTYNKDLMAYEARCEAVPGSYTGEVSWSVLGGWSSMAPTYLSRL